MNDAIDEKLARISARLAVERETVRSHLEQSPELLALWDACKEIVGARFGYLRVGGLEKGDRAAFDETGHPYNFDLRPTHAATRDAGDYDNRTAAHVTPNRSRDEPYRGRSTGRKRRPKPPAGGGAGRPDPMAWIDRS